MTELQELLYRAGHRPPKHGKAWICASCPPGKSPALKVAAEVFYCHRCQKGGNVVTLKRELGIDIKPRRDSESEQRAKRLAALKLKEIRAWQRRWRGYLVRRFQQACDAELRYRDEGQRMIVAGQEISGDLLNSAIEARVNRECMESWLNWFDGLSNSELIQEYDHYRTVMSDEQIRGLATSQRDRGTVSPESRTGGTGSNPVRSEQANAEANDSSSISGPSSGASAVC